MMKKRTGNTRKMRTIPQIAILLVLVIGVQSVFAQQRQNMDRDHNEQVTIIGSFDPTINQAYKINTRPEQKPLLFTAPEFTFQSIDTHVATDIQPSQVNPASMKGRKKVKSYDSFLKAGFGSKLTPLIDFYHSSGKSGSHQFSAGVHHFSSFSDIADYSPSPYSKTRASIDFAKYFNDHAFDIGLEYGLNSNRYYGYKPADFDSLAIPADELKQSFNLIRAKLGLGSRYSKANKLHHQFNIDAYYYFDKFDVKETFASFDFDIYKGFKVTDVLDYQNFGLEGKVAYFGNQDSVNSSTDLIVEGVPYFSAKYNIFAFKVGVRLAYIQASTSTFDVYPVIDVAVTAIPDALVIYAGVDGNIQKNTYLNLTTVNPWFTPYGIPDTNLRWQNNKLMAYGGVRGNIAKKLAFNLELRWQKFEDMAFFVNKSEYFVQPDTAIPVFVGTNNKFTILHDKGSVFTFKGELSYTLTRQFNIWLGGQFNSYSLDSLAQAYHKPLTEVKFGAGYTFARKLNIWTEILYSGKRYAVLQSGVPIEEELDAYIDLNLGAEYAISETFSVFLTATNLLNNNYEKFYNYPVQGLNIIGGIGLKF